MLPAGEKDLSNDYPGYDSKLSDDEAPVLEPCGMWSTPSLPLLPGSLGSREVIPVRVMFTSQIELFNHFPYLKPFNYW